MKAICQLLVAALMLGFSAGARAQNSSGASVTPHATASKSYGADVLWYGKAPPGWGGTVTEMKLIAPGVGWAQRAERLYWTSDNGANWRDITPPIEHVGAVFFLDAKRGWASVGYRYSYENPLTSDELVFKVASTADAGATWSVTKGVISLKKNNISKEDISAYGSGAITFADPSHGWITIGAQGQTHLIVFDFLMITSDGGATWHQLLHHPDLNGIDSLLVTPAEGWMIGNGSPLEEDNDRLLYVTRDGAQSWQRVSLPIPKRIARTDFGPATCEVMDVPQFENSKHGFLEASCSNYRDGNTHNNYALFATDDGGQTWTPDRVVANVNEYQAHLYGCSAVADSEWIFAASPGPDLPPFTPRHSVLITDDVIVTKVDAGARIDARLDAADLRAALPAPLTDSRLDLRFYGDARQCSFVTPSDGWVIVGEGDLKSTTDGGKTWKDIVPGPKPHVIQPYGN